MNHVAKTAGKKPVQGMPFDQVLLDAYKEAQVLAQCTQRTEKAMRASALPTFNGVGDSDIVGIERALMRRSHGFGAISNIETSSRTSAGNRSIMYAAC